MAVPGSANLLDRRLLFVTGKGGVGKTSVASALGLLAAQEGKRTLVCEADAKGNLADFYGVGPIGFHPTEVRPGLFVMAMDTEESLREYLKLQLRLPLIARLGPLARTFDFVATAAPGVREILTVGKLAYEVRERNYDLVVVDASASGHVVGQLGSPVALSELVSVGVVKAQTDWMLQLLTDPAITGVVVVATPEEMPVRETLELIERLDSETSVDVAAVVANRVLPELFHRDEAECFARLSAAHREDPTRAAGVDLDPVGFEAVLGAAEMARELRKGRSEHLTVLREGLNRRVAAGHRRIDVINVPALFQRSHGVRATQQIAEHLAEELVS